MTRIILQYPDQLRIRGLDNGDKVKIREGLRLIDLLNKIELEQRAAGAIEPRVNGHKVSLQQNLHDGDQLQFTLKARKTTQA